MCAQETPKASSRRSLVQPSTSEVLHVDADEAELAQRKRERAKARNEERRQTMTNTPAPRLSSVGLSSSQLKEQYSTCIKMAHSNKITVKNAFALNIIDYM